MFNKLFKKIILKYRKKKKLFYKDYDIEQLYLNSQDHEIL